MAEGGTHAAPGRVHAPLPEPRRRHVRGRDGEIGRRRLRMGRHGDVGRPRQRRLPGSRHRQRRRAEPRLPQQGRRDVREDGEDGPRGREVHGRARGPRRRRRRAPGRLHRELPRDGPRARIQGQGHVLHDARRVQGAGQPDAPEPRRLEIRGRDGGERHAGSGQQDDRRGRARLRRRRAAPTSTSRTTSGATRSSTTRAADVSATSRTRPAPGYPEEGSATAFGRRTRSGMGLVATDFDGDGRPDLYVTNYANEPDTLYRNVEGATFAESEREAFGGDHDPVLPLSKWGVVALDCDNDGGTTSRSRAARSSRASSRSSRSGSIRRVGTSPSARGATRSGSSSSTTRARPGR